MRDTARGLIFVSDAVSTSFPESTEEERATEASDSDSRQDRSKRIDSARRGRVRRHLERAAHQQAAGSPRTIVHSPTNALVALVCSQKVKLHQLAYI